MTGGEDTAPHLTRRGAGRAPLVALLLILVAGGSVGGYFALHHGSQTASIRNSGSSMDPVIPDGATVDYRPVTSATDLSRGDIALFQPPGDTNRRFLKRVLALPGDSVEIVPPSTAGASPTLYVEPSGQTAWYTLRESYLAADAWRLPTTCCDGAGKQVATPHAAVVPADSLFVLGDSRDRSVDSRVFGWVSMSMLTDFTAQEGVVVDVQGRASDLGHPELVSSAAPPGA